MNRNQQKLTEINRKSTMPLKSTTVGDYLKLVINDNSVMVDPRNSLERIPEYHYLDFLNNIGKIENTNEYIYSPNGEFTYYFNYLKLDSSKYDHIVVLNSSSGLAESKVLFANGFAQKQVTFVDHNNHNFLKLFPYMYHDVEEMDLTELTENTLVLCIWPYNLECYNCETDHAYEDLKMLYENGKIRTLVTLLSEFAGTPKLKQFLLSVINSENFDNPDIMNESSGGFLWKTHELSYQETVSLGYIHFK